MSDTMQSYLDRMDQKTGNTLGGDLWRLAMEARDALQTMRREIGPALEMEKSLSEHIAGLERRWSEELTAGDGDVPEADAEAQAEGM